MSSYEFLVTIESNHGPVEPEDVLRTLIGAMPLQAHAKHVQVQATTVGNRGMPEIENEAACAVGQHAIPRSEDDRIEPMPVKPTRAQRKRPDGKAKASGE